MFRFSMMLVSIGLATLLHAQSSDEPHPFYKQSFDFGKRAMDDGDWAMADEYLEIAAFGMLEKPKFLGDVYVLLVILSHKQGHEDNLKSRVAKLERLIEKELWEPIELSSEVWDRYQVITGAKKPPPPPIPKDLGQLEAFVNDHRDIPGGWVALARLYIERKESRKVRRTLSDGLEADPDNVPLLELALTYSANNNQKRSARDYTTALLKSDPNNDLANEYLGNEAVKDKNYTLAQTHYSKVVERTIPETPGLQQRMSEALAKAAQERLKKTRQEEAKKEAEREAKLAREKREADRKARAEKDQLEKDRKAQLEKEKREQARQARLDRRKDTKNKTADETQQAVATKKDSGKTKPNKRRDRKADTKKPESATKTASNSNKKSPPRGKGKPAGSKDVAEARLASLDAKITAAKAQVKANPKDGKLKFTLLDLYFEKNDLKSAGKLLKKIGKSNANDPLYSIAFARYKYLGGKYKAVIQALSKYKNPSDPLRYYLGMSYFRSNKLTEAQATLSGLDRQAYPALVAVDKDLNARLPKASRLKKNEPTETSRGAAKKEDPPGESELARSLRLIDQQILAEDWRSAKRSIRKAASDYPKNLDVQYFRGRMFLQQGKFKKAAQLLYNLSNNGYKKREIYYYGGLAFHREGDAVLAKHMFKMAEIEGTRFTREIKAITQPRNATIENLSGNPAIASKIRELETKIGGSGDASSRISLLRLYKITGNENEFAKTLKSLRSQNLNSQQSDILLAWTLGKNGQYPSAIRTLRPHKGDEILFLIGYFHQQAGAPDRAKPYFSRLAGNHNFPEIKTFIQ